MISKKNNHSSVSGADREIPTLGSTDNAGNSENRISGIIRLPSGWDFSVCNDQRPMMGSIFHTYKTEFVLFLAVLANSVLLMG